MNNNVNKAGINRIPKDLYTITSADVMNYLQNTILGFNVAYDFTRWTGVTPEHSYVRMRCVLTPKDIVASSTSNDYVDRILNENAAGITYDKDVIDSLTPFMYPKSISNIYNHKDDLERLAKYGVYGERLTELIRFSRINFSEQTGLFCICLRPERIIADMLADPSTNTIDGKMEIVGVHGTTSETIRWDVEVSRTNNIMNTSEISIDTIFTK
jgi:hypothetical protein